MLQTGNNLDLRPGDFTGNGIRHCRRAAAVILAGDNQSRMYDRRLRSDQFTHAMRENSTTGGIALRIIRQNPIADKRNDIGAFSEEGWREPARQRLINGGPRATPFCVRGTFFNKCLRLRRSFMG